MLPIVGTIVAVYAITRLILVAVEHSHRQDKAITITAIIILPILIIGFLAVVLNLASVDTPGT